MKRTRPKRRSGLGQIEEQLVRCAVGLAESGSRAEDLFWENQLIEMIDQVLDEQDEALLDTALDHLYNANLLAYEELADLIESRAETSLRTTHAQEVLLIAAPILAWSRFRIPTPLISQAVRTNLRTHLRAHVLADNVQLALTNHLFSPDQLPQGFCPTAEFAKALGASALKNEDFTVDAKNIESPTQFLSDTRYLLGAVSAPKGAPIFRWQENDCSREQAFTQWRAQGGAVLAPLLPGCAIELVLPETYFSASRQADKAARPYAIRASVAYLSAMHEVPAKQLRATIAPFYERQLEEYRIGFTREDQETVIHGVIWPLLGAEEENSENLTQIESVLRDSGVTAIEFLDHRFPVEYCEDCGTPLYPSPEGEAVHVEPSEEDSAPPSTHLH